MEHILEKLSQYSIVTNILPGSVLCLMLKFIVGYDFVVFDNILETFIVFYFLGLINNRIGSIAVKNILQKLSIIKEEPYELFVDTEYKDSKIVQLLQDYNTYRCYITVVLLIIVAKIYKFIDSKISIDMEIVSWVVLILLLCLFILSYRKQLGFIKKRIHNVTK